MFPSHPTKNYFLEKLFFSCQMPQYEVWSLLYNPLFKGLVPRF